jgi:hypothetical protein
MSEPEGTQVYDDCCGQSSWTSTTNYDRFNRRLDVTADACVLDSACERVDRAAAGLILLRREDTTASLSQFAFPAQKPP